MASKDDDTQERAFTVDSPQGAQRCHSRAGVSFLSHKHDKHEAPHMSSEEAAAMLRKFLEEKADSILQCWVHHFDTNNDQTVSQIEFSHALRSLGYKADPKALLNLLDEDRSGELSLEEIDKDSSDLWRDFRHWCVERYDSIEDMMRQIGYDSDFTNPGVSFHSFVNGIAQHGWQGGEEELLFGVLDVHSAGRLTKDSMAWLDSEIRLKRRKEQAKSRAASEVKRRIRKINSVRESVLYEFKRFLKSTYRDYIRAWRVGLCPEGGMCLQKNQFFKSCARIGWQRDVRMLWKAFDKDDSGHVSIDELDLQSAEMLARFHDVVGRVYGSAAAAFRAFDMDGTRRVKLKEFVTVMHEHGFKAAEATTLFRGFDRSGAKVIVYEDLVFLDKWKPLPFLLATPNEKGKEEFKAALIRHFKTYLRAWRRILDKDGTNRCNWDEFQGAVKRINYTGDAAGAWRALDEDLSGFITLHEIDEASSETLREFRQWADREFGGVRCAFGCFDDDNSNKVTMKEWRRACRVYGYAGNASTLFRSLDVEATGSLTIQEVAFLDDWDFVSDQGAENTTSTAGEATEFQGSSPQGIVISRPVSVPKTPRVLERTVEKNANLWQAPPAGLARVASSSLFGPSTWLDEEKRISKMRRLSPVRKQMFEEDRRVVPSLQLANNVYSKVPFPGFARPMVYPTSVPSSNSASRTKLVAVPQMVAAQVAAAAADGKGILGNGVLGSAAVDESDNHPSAAGSDVLPAMAGAAIADGGGEVVAATTSGVSLGVNDGASAEASEGSEGTADNFAGFFTARGSGEHPRRGALLPSHTAFVPLMLEDENAVALAAARPESSRPKSIARKHEEDRPAGSHAHEQREQNINRITLESLEVPPHSARAHTASASRPQGSAGPRASTAAGGGRKAGRAAVAGSNGAECGTGLMPTLDDILLSASNRRPGLYLARPRNGAQKPWMRLPGMAAESAGAACDGAKRPMPMSAR